VARRDSRIYVDNLLTRFKNWLEKEGSTKPESAAEHDSTLATKAGVPSEEGPRVPSLGEIMSGRDDPVVGRLETYSANARENEQLSNGLDPEKRSTDLTTGQSEADAAVDPVLLQSVASYLEYVSGFKGRHCSRSRINGFL